MKTYSDKLKDPRWQKLRLEIFKRDKWTCKMCKDKETTLHIHHLSYKSGKEPWDYEKNNFVTVCEDCHELIEYLKEREVKSFNLRLLKIYKSSGWQSGNYIMFYNYDGVSSFRIYNDKKEYIIGFNLLFTTVFEIRKIFNFNTSF